MLSFVVLCGWLSEEHIGFVGLVITRKTKNEVPILVVVETFRHVSDWQIIGNSGRAAAHRIG